MSVQAADRQQPEVREEKKERSDKVDYKMVTFSLAGKEYGIDIMNVKEIASAGRFTYVPNAAPFVRGVYNLRGDIISIIDLRIMFHLPAERKDNDALESLLILRIGEHVFGIIVDNIDKVVGVSRANIQAPHPIFGDINVKYIQGIIENQGKLYIILNVEKLFGLQKDADGSPVRPADAKPAFLDQTVVPSSGQVAPVPAFQAPALQSGPAKGDVDAEFIRETLFTFKRFGVSEVNRQWFETRYAEWRSMRKPGDVQLKELSDADGFLQGFYSPHTGELWSADYAKAVMSALPSVQTRSINVWNPGCGKGYETYSFACALRRAFPEARIKIWANDSDLLAISMAPNMVFNEENVPEAYKDLMVKGRNGWTFEQAVRDSIFFEFHDVLNGNPVPPVDIILCRDTLSFLPVADQQKLIGDFEEKVKQGGAVVLGANERLVLDGWKQSGGGNVPVFIKGA
jgi:purine-binding chemotaxis protein CheW